MTPPQASFAPGVDDIFAALIPGVASSLGDNLVGVYLCGSLATGDFIETSDIDFVVAIERPVSDAEVGALIEMHARLAALPNPYADRLEGAYIDRASLRRFEPGREFLTIDCETPLRWKEHETSSLIERYVLREKGVALLGPDPKSLIGRRLSVDADGRPIEVVLRIDTPMEAEYLRHGGILQYVLRQHLHHSSA